MVGSEQLPRLSIVVGCRLQEVDPGACLESLRSQLRPNVEVLVVNDSGVADKSDGWTTLVRDGGLVPQLWSLGLARAQGDLIALTSGSVVPEGDWVYQLLHQQDDGAAVVGGAIEPSRHLRLVDWAVYFCRYTPYMLPLAAETSMEVPGDNAVYRREVLRDYQHLYRDEFWEPFIHKALRDDGHVFEFDPNLVVRQARGMDLAGFARQRFLHGRSHGRLRSAGLSRGRILAETLTFPLVPFLLAARAGRNVLRKRRHELRFLASLPVLLFFTSAWAFGELLGRIDALVGRR